MRHYLKKLWSFASHHNGVVVALELAIFTGVIFTFAAENNNQNNNLAIEQFNNSETTSEPISPPAQENSAITPEIPLPVISQNNQELGIIKEDLEELEIKEVIPEKFAFKTLDGAIIEIGTEIHSPPQPYLKLGKWDNEVFLKITIPYDVAGKPQIFEGKLRYAVSKNNELGIMNYETKILNWLFPSAVAQNNAGTMDIDFYPKEPEEITEIDSLGNEHKFIQNEQGGVEFDTILYEKPKTNQIVFPIETKGLRFLYQPPLNQERQEAGLTCTETTCYDENGTVTTFRPENVAGSYAVYHSGNPINYVGGKEYKTGKAFHIYRPKVNDSAGNEIWGKLNIEAGLFSEGLAEEGILSITIDQDWLDNAVYPVTIDPEFGYHANGLSVYNIWDYLYAYNYTGGAGTISSFSAYYDDSVGKLHIILYDDSNRIDYGAERTINGGNALDWYTDNAVVGATISAQTYYMGFYTDSGSDWYYDTDDTGHNQYEAVAYSSPPPATWSKTQSTAHRKFSIYCTYTAWQPRPGLISPSGGGFLIF